LVATPHDAEAAALERSSFAITLVGKLALEQAKGRVG
jgi:hypothetical protein